VSKYLQAFLARQPECQLPLAPKGDDRSPAGAIGTNDTNGNWRGTATDFGDDIERAAIIEHCARLPADVADRHAREGWNADDWRRWHDELVERRRRFGETEIEARCWAFGALGNEWHARHGAVPGPGHCAGCGKPIDAADVMTWPDGARVHDLACAIRWGEHWRARAAEGVVTLGIAAPAGWTP